MYSGSLSSPVRIKAFNWLPGRSTASTEGSLGREVRRKPWRTSVFWLVPAQALLPYTTHSYLLIAYSELDPSPVN